MFYCISYFLQHLILPVSQSQFTSLYVSVRNAYELLW